MVLYVNRNRPEFQRGTIIGGSKKTPSKFSAFVFSSGVLAIAGTIVQVLYVITPERYADLLYRDHEQIARTLLDRLQYYVNHVSDGRRSIYHDAEVQLPDKSEMRRLQIGFDNACKDAYISRTHRINFDSHMRASESLI